MSNGLVPTTIRQMLAPAFYPHPTADRVRLVETHISYVLLTGEYAYKVKKPVNLGFLDFSTLERRRRFCEEEVRLNGRGAPGMYLGVVPITYAPGSAEGVVLDGSGPAAEYAVRMRQFPDDALLSVKLERGEVGEADVRQLAVAVAAYHAGSRVIDGGRFGSPELIRADLEQNYRRTKKYVGGLMENRWFAETRRATDEFFERHSPVLWSRIDQGYVRECHGDLHLGNVCRWQGRTLLFDCIEFNEAFRKIDVFCDVGFAAMDFHASGYPALANAFVNEYAEQTGDWAGLRVLPLYLCRNAYVRAMVNSILLDAMLDPVEAGLIRSRATRYYELAWQYARPRRGRLVLMCGMSGSGKTTLARNLAGQWGAVHIRSDAVRKHLAGVALDRRANAATYSPIMTRRTYERLQDLGLALAADGFTVILDARYARAKLRTAVASAAAQRGVPLRILHCVAPPDVLRERLEGHDAGSDVSDSTPDLLDEQLREQEPFGPAEAPHVLSLDTRRPVHELVTEVDSWRANDARSAQRLTLTSAV